MGYVVKHSTSNVNKTRRKGNVALGVSSEGYDKTATSGFYAGVPPVEGKHNFVRVSGGGDPNFYSLTDEELVNFVNGLGERNLTHLTPSQGGWAGTYSVIDSDTRTFNLTTRQDNAATTSAWRTFYWNVSAYEGQTVAISADVEFVSETNCTFSSFTIGQGNTGQYTIHIAGSDAADRVTISTKPTTPTRMEWAGVINATGIVGFTFWINNVTANGANSVVRVSNVQIEVNNHVTEFSSPNAVVYNVVEAFNYLNEREDIIFTNDVINNNIVTDNLVLNLNASFKSSFSDNQPTDNLAVVTSYASIWNNSGNATWNSDDNDVPRLFPDLPVFSMRKDTNGNSHLGVGYVSSGISEGVECTYSVYVWIPSSNSAGMSGAPPYMRPFPANYNETYLSYNGSTSWGSWPRDQWIRVEGTGIPNSTSSGGVSTAYISSYLNTAGDKIYYTAPQFENKSISTPFVSGSRSQNTTWYDLSGNGNAVAVNSPVFANNSFTFDETNEYFSLTNNELTNISGSVTLMGVCKQGNTGTPHQTILCTDINYRNGLKLLSRYHGAAATWIGNSDGTDSYLLSSGVNITNDGKWHHLATTRDVSTGELKIYVDGILKNSVTTYTGATHKANIAAVGVDYHSSGYYYVGNISSVQAYDEVLLSDKILQNYYGGPIVTDSLVLAMDAGNLVSYESGSTTAYSLTGSNSTSLNNGVGFSQNQGGAWEFDGTDDYIGGATDFPQVLFDNDESHSFGFWVKKTGTQSGNYAYLYDKYGASRCPGILFVLTSNTLAVEWWSGGWQFLNTGLTLEENIWNYVTVTIDAPGAGQTKTVKVYVYKSTGLTTAVRTNTTDWNASSNGQFAVGKSISNNTYFQGKIAQVTTYSKKLSDQEVLQNYNAQKARFI